MRELLRLFTQIAVLRKGPQDLPVSMLLLALTLCAYLGVNFLITSALPGNTHWPDERWQGLLLLEALFTMTWYVVLLKIVGRPERALQTLTALFGLGAVLSPLLIAAQWLLRRFGEDATWSAPVVCLFLVMVAWLIAANSHVVKAALEWSTSASVALVILQMLASTLVLVTVLSFNRG
jgi:drug/metabolite transporter (DMT)-like permease